MTYEQQVYRAGTGLPEWADEVLGRRAYAVLGTLRPDGSVHTVPLMYTFDGERFLFESRSTTRKVRNIEAHPRARVLVQGSIEHERWIAADGAAEVVYGQDAAKLNAAVVDRYLTEAGGAGWNATIAPLEDVTIVLRPERWTWWDIAGMLGAITAHGYTAEEAAGWFHPLDP
jgi:PPOX class probable F420-dependent enzyme